MLFQSLKMLELEEGKGQWSDDLLNVYVYIQDEVFFLNNFTRLILSISDDFKHIYKS